MAAEASWADLSAGLRQNGAMASLAGSLLVASPRLLDPNFFRAVVFVLEHDEAGALGVVLDRPSTTGPDEELPDWVPLLADPSVVFVGGPVQPQIAIGLAGGVEGSPLPGVGIVDLGAPPGDVGAPVRVYAGYAGWGPGQLEAELGESSWIVTEASASDVFTTEPEDLWRTVLGRQSGVTAWLANFPVDPRLN